MTSGTALATARPVHEDGTSVHASELDGTATITVSGEIDFRTVEALEAVLRTLVARDSGRIVVDLAAVTFMDSAGLRVLLRAREQMTAAGRWFTTRGATGQPRRLLDIGRIHYGVTI